MKLKDELTEEEQKRLVIAGTIMVVVFFSICLISFYFLFVADSAISVSSLMKSGASGFASLRMVLPVIFILWFLPGSMLAETTDCWVKKRSFRPRNVLTFLLLFGEALLIAGLLYTLFDTIFPEVSFLVQFPLIVAGFITGLLLTVATIEKTRIKGYVKRAFD